MNRYFNYFKIPLIITAIVAVISGIAYGVYSSSINYERANEFYDNKYCVFDMADKLTDEEEQSLNELIKYWEKEACTDIVLITLDDAEYGYLDAVRSYADWFSEEYQMGFDGPGGSAIVFVDNWSRGGDGKIHSWISTTGSVREHLSDDDAVEILYILDEIENDAADPYIQYCKIIEECGKEARPLQRPYGGLVCVIFGLIVAITYVIINWRSKLGDVQVTPNTYLKDGRVEFPVKRDLFLNSVVTKHKIETSSSGGSSGGGGGSHGGGGHSR